MNFSSLPQFPSARPSVAPVGTSLRPLSPRLARLLLCLSVLSAAALLLYVLWPVVDAMTNPPAPMPTAPFSFKVIEQRYRQVQPGLTVGEVRRLLGPPSSSEAEGRAIIEEERRYHPDMYPGDADSWVLLRWTDPNDKHKWVTVLFLDGKVYFTRQDGF